MTLIILILFIGCATFFNIRQNRINSALEKIIAKLKQDRALIRQEQYFEETNVFKLERMKERIEEGVRNKEYRKENIEIEKTIQKDINYLEPILAKYLIISAPFYEKQRREEAEFSHRSDYSSSSSSSSGSSGSDWSGGGGSFSGGGSSDSW